MPKKDDVDYKKAGCGCASFIPPFIGYALIESGQLEGFWGTVLVFAVIIMSYTLIVLLFKDEQ